MKDNVREWWEERILDQMINGESKVTPLTDLKTINSNGISGRWMVNPNNRLIFSIGNRRDGTNGVSLTSNDVLGRFCLLHYLQVGGK